MATTDSSPTPKPPKYDGTLQEIAESLGGMRDIIEECCLAKDGKTTLADAVLAVRDAIDRLTHAVKGIRLSGKSE